MPEIRDASEADIGHIAALYGREVLKGTATLEETAREVAITYAIALAVIFLVLCAQFEGFTSAVVVTLIVPFGVAAAVLALFLTGTSVNIYSQIGLVLLIGLMAKNSVLLVEFADQLRDRGLAIREAVEGQPERRAGLVAAVRQRLCGLGPGPFRHGERGVDHLVDRLQPGDQQLGHVVDLDQAAFLAVETDAHLLDPGRVADVGHRRDAVDAERYAD